MKEGWLCPKCGRGVSPNKSYCTHGDVAGVQHFRDLQIATVTADSLAAFRFSGQYTIDSRYFHLRAGARD